MALTDTAARGAKATAKPYKLADAQGLYLEVRPSGSKLWRYRYRISCKENVFALGEYMTDKRHPDHVSLEVARERRNEARKLVREGIHPAHQRKAQSVAQQAQNRNTFEAVALEWLDKQRPEFAPKYVDKIECAFRGDLFPYIGPLPMRSITPMHLLEIIQRIDQRGAPTVAVAVRQWLSSIFRYAVATLRADADPAAALKGAVKRPKVKHHRPLDRSEIAELVRRLAADTGSRITHIAMELLLLTFVRPGELRGARWEEIDIDRAEWRIPAERMKKREMHIVPLSTQALTLMRELHTFTGMREHLFPNVRRPNTFMASTTLNRAIERIGVEQFSPHGFRATASTLLNELGYRSDVIERQLSHAERNQVRASYNQAAYMEERRQVMQDWADLIDGLANESGATIVPIKSVSAA